MHAVIDKMARGFALLGGAVLSGLILLTCLSVLGRALNGILHSDFAHDFCPALAQLLLNWGIGPINGDFELVEAGMAFTIFAFLPLCQLYGAHAAVDIFTAKLPEPVKKILEIAIAIVFALVLILIAWQLLDGLLSKRRSGQTTFLLEFPIWWAYAISLVAASVAALTGIYVAIMHITEFLTRQKILPRQAEAEH